MLKQCFPVFDDKYLSEAYRNSIKKTFREFLKLAKVVPIFKIGDKTSPENYRPMSLLCLSKKIFEKLLFDRMVHFSMKKTVFNWAFWFLKKISCNHGISTVTDYMRGKNDQKNLEAIVFHWCPESVGHSRLINTVERIKFFGYKGPILKIWVTFQKKSSSLQQMITIRLEN